MKRLITNEVKIKDRVLGGGNLILIQSMTNTDSEDCEKTIEQIKSLENAGVDLIRVSIPSSIAAKNIKHFKKTMNVPLIADIHNDYKLAIMAIKNGADKIRINPGNIGGIDKLRKVVNEAKKKNIPIRIGVNSGSIEKEIQEKLDTKIESLVASAFKNVKLFYDEFGYKNIVLSIKSSDVYENYVVHKKLIKRFLDERVEIPPLHLGITEAGVLFDATIKSSIGIGGLLLKGIGDTIRVSITGDPLKEIAVARGILKSLNMLEGAIDLVCCPTCSRTKVDLEKIALAIKNILRPIEAMRIKEKRNRIKFAVMGCPVNGLGEAKDADLGFFFLKETAVVYFKGQKLFEKSVDEIMNEKFIYSLIKNIDKNV